MHSVSVILSGYKRQHLAEQVAAIKAQTYPVQDILYWQNTLSGWGYDTETSAQLKSAISNSNYGVWARFAYALNATTDFINVIDDDTIPGVRWIENCIRTHETHPGLLGGIGLRFKNDNYELDYEDNIPGRYGWDSSCNNNCHPVDVDIVGHSWFFTRDMLSVFWSEIPGPEWSRMCCEDIHFSYMIQKHTTLKTWVPSHPPEDQSQWSSLKGMQYGGDAHAAAYINLETGEMAKYLKHCVANGFRLYRDRRS